MNIKAKISLILGLFVLLGVVVLLTINKSETVVLHTQRERANQSSKANEFEDRSLNKTPTQWKAINPDFQFMLEVNGKQVPVVKGKDNKQYLHTNIYGEDDFYGVPYLDYQNHVDDDNLIVYGHSSTKKDLVFSFVKEYENDKYWDTTVFLIGADKNVEYAPIALVKIDQNHQENYMGFIRVDYTMQEAESYLNELKTHAYKEKIARIQPSKLLTLITCNLQGDDNQRYALVLKEK